jgi:hypothetical protein
LLDQRGPGENQGGNALGVSGGEADSDSASEGVSHYDRWSVTDIEDLVDQLGVTLGANRLGGGW